jgi:N-acetyl-gamma-glutamyl-phosphate reductase
MSAEDNIGKGASSQAVQNFNIAFGYPATSGLMQV